MKVHKRDITKRSTVCGIEYEKVRKWGDFIVKQTVGHWKKVTCKNCIKKKSYYETRANRKIWKT